MDFILERILILRSFYLDSLSFLGLRIVDGAIMNSAFCPHFCLGSTLILLYNLSIGLSKADLVGASKVFEYILEISLISLKLSILSLSTQNIIYKTNYQHFSKISCQRLFLNIFQSPNLQSNFQDFFKYCLVFYLSEFSLNTFSNSIHFPNSIFNDFKKESQLERASSAFKEFLNQKVRILFSY